MIEKGLLIKDIKAGTTISGLFLAGGYQLHPYRNKPGNYLSLTLADLSGTIVAKVWDWSQDSTPPAEGSILKCDGKAAEFAGSVEVHLSRLLLIDQTTVDPGDFLPSSPVPIESMVADLKKLVADLNNEHLKALLNQFMAEEKLFKNFCRAPAAKQIHQAYQGGLLEHSLQTARIASMVAGLYPAANRDLVVAGALLHDLGKVVEYNYDFTIDFTDEGRLLGHIILGLELLDSLVAKVKDFPEKLRLALRHILTSHHGKYEWQSPKKPKIIEACLIHYADAIEADMWKFSMLRDKFGNQGWSPYERSLERAVFLGDLVE